MDGLAAGRGAAWLARLSGGQEVPSSNLGAPMRKPPLPGLSFPVLRTGVRKCQRYVSGRYRTLRVPRPGGACARPLVLPGRSVRRVTDPYVEGVAGQVCGPRDRGSSRGDRREPTTERLRRDVSESSGEGGVRHGVRECPRYGGSPVRGIAVTKSSSRPRLSASSASSRRVSSASSAGRISVEYAGASCFRGTTERASHASRASAVRRPEAQAPRDRDRASGARALRRVSSR